ncbi:hypothetical protein CK503_12810 [Aliifodinibius salipaludis]|uniref:DUF4402 domain-containing protein n=1 Tax=Fodinibius salipaludis TaxID=2032627 RepID=A0A2A2G8X6_9BACT|nr:hypothetical protein [Aliifodinibius salipaludis]PAU93297.1 hypothetical protein CK503_12810 [Aliifodinibius salipaludis]
MINPNIDTSILAKTFLLAVILFLVNGIASQAQFIDLQLNIDSKITARTEQPLEFGTLMTNSGRRMIELGSPNMGIFSITALENQMLLVTLDKPTELRHMNPSIDDVIPLELFSRYAYSARNYETSYPLSGTVSSIKIEPNSDPGPWNSIYIFMHGSVDVGNVRDGTYANEIVLSVVYL